MYSEFGSNILQAWQDMFFLCVAHVIHLFHMLTHLLGMPVKEQQK